MNSAGGLSWRHLLVQQKRSPARQVLATRGQAASYAAAAQHTPQEPAELACCESRSLWLEDGLGCQCPHRVRRCSCQGQRDLGTLGGGTRHWTNLYPSCRTFSLPVCGSRSRILGVVLQIRRKAPYWLVPYQPKVRFVREPQ